MSEQASKPARRRASRAAGPASNAEPVAVTPVDSVAVDGSRPVPRRSGIAAGPPPRRVPNRGRVALAAVLTLVVLAGVVAGGIAWMLVAQKDERTQMARDQRFVDTASQLVVNMFSYNQNDIDDSVNRFVDGTSGPLRDMLSQDNNVENLKAIFRDTEATSEAVINGAALEKVDNISNNAAVLVSVRVTVTDIDGTNKPSQPYRMRVIVHEDDNGHMTGYDLKYPDGGN